MCGIFGYYHYRAERSPADVVGQLLNGLKRLEYRGYDSAGVCIDSIDALDAQAGSLGPDTPPRSLCEDEQLPSDDQEGSEGSASVLSQPHVIKCAGKVSDLEAMAAEYLRQHKLDAVGPLGGSLAISHTRWATHGPPCPTNAHPHVSGPDMEFVVVHNGIITNYKALREYLEKHGEVFVSDTDTEVIPKLCKYVHNSMTQEGKELPFPKLIMEVLSKLEGAYALLVKSTHYPGELVAAKRGSPMIVGLSVPQQQEQQQQPASEASAGAQQPLTLTRRSSVTEPYSGAWERPLECWVASDASAVVEHTKQVIVLEDDDVLHVARGAFGIYNRRGRDPDTAVDRLLQTLDLEVGQIMKGDFDSFMQKEIHEQPEALLQTMTGRVRAAAQKTCSQSFRTNRLKLGGLVDHVDIIRKSRRIVFVACGTSYHACMASRALLEEMLDVPVALELASDFLDRRAPVFRDDTCVFVSQSGETADTLQALEYAKSRGALCVGITNSVGSAISRATDCGVYTHAGPEIGVASTKAYTCQILCMVLMALSLSADSISKRDKREAVIDALEQLPTKVAAALQLDGAMRQLAEQLKDSHSLLFCARGSNHATALEAALKVKEIAIMHSEGILGGELKHGPLALVDESMPIVVVATRDSMHQKMQSVIQQLLARDARLIVLCSEGDDAMSQFAGKHCQLIQVPQTADCLQSIVNIVPLQLLAYHLTVLRGHNVDQPRNLAKSVTVVD